MIAKKGLLACAVLFCGVATADDRPPIDPGLWQIHAEREVNGVKMEDPTARMKDLPPEARERMQALMKQRGVDMGSGGDIKLCLSADSLDKGNWQRSGSGNCQTTYSSQTRSLWKWHSVCTAPPSEGDGEAHFIDQNHYTVDATNKSSHAGKPSTMHVSIDAHRLGSDCGDVAPLTAPPAGVPQRPGGGN